MERVCGCYPHRPGGLCLTSAVHNVSGKHTRVLRKLRMAGTLWVTDRAAAIQQRRFQPALFHREWSSTAYNMPQKALAAGIAAVLALGIGAVAPAQADTRSYGGAQDWTIPTAASPGVTDLPLDAFPEDALSPVPLAVHSVLAGNAFGAVAPVVHGVAWDHGAGVARVYADRDALDSVAAALQPHSSLFAVTPTLFTNRELSDATYLAIERWRLIAGGNDSFSVIPALDGSSLHLEIEDGPRESDLLDRAPGLSEESFGNLGVPYEVSKSSAEAATRYQTQPPYAAGSSALYRVSNGEWRSCTNGFYVIDTGTRATYNLTADHCSDAIGQMWWIANNEAGVTPSLTAGTRLGQSLGQANGGNNNTDHELLRAFNSQEPYVLTGGPDNPGPKSPIRGWTAPVVNDVVCYSGSPSGLRCGNIVGGTEITTCYNGIPYCYYGLTRTYQQNGLPAAGQGDSGGPVIQVFAGSGGTARVFATGVVSGIYDYAGKPCAGKQGRSCSDLVSYAPLSRFFPNNQQYGLAIVP